MHVKEFVYDADHPKVLVGRDQAPTPVEFLLHALASCLTAGIGNIAAARGVTLSEVESRVEGDIDLRGILGLSDQVRNGYQQLQRQLHDQGRRAAGRAREDRRAVAQALRRVRRPDQGRPGHDLGERGVSSARGLPAGSCGIRPAASAGRGSS